MVTEAQVRSELLDAIDFCVGLVEKGSSPERGAVYAATARDLAEAYELLSRHPGWTPKDRESTVHAVGAAE